MAVVTRSANMELMEEGLRGVFFDRYGMWMKEWTKVFRDEKSNKRQETTLSLVGTGVIPKKPEGEPVSQITPEQGWKGTIVHDTFSADVEVTQEMQEDDLYSWVVKYPKVMARSMNQTEEIEAALVLDRGHNSVYTGPDGIELFATNHPLKKTGGTEQNELTTGADMTVQTFMDMINGIEETVLDDGTLSMVIPKKVIFPAELEFLTGEILDSQLRAHTADNTTNVLRGRGLEHVMMHYLTDADAFFLQSDLEDQGLIRYNRISPQFVRLTAVDTGDQIFRTRARWSHTWDDFRGIYSNKGGA